MYDALVANVYMFYDTSISLVRDRSNCTTRRTAADREHYAPAYLFYEIKNFLPNSAKILIINLQRTFANAC